MTQNNSDQPARFEARYASTRVVQLDSGQVVAFTPEALENMARQINDGPFIPVHVEHLAYLSPVGRVASARLEVADDGALELIGIIEMLPHIDPKRNDPDPVSPMPPTLMPATLDESVPFEVLLEPRNFTPGDFTELEVLAPVPVQRRSQWAELPPLEILFIFQVTTGLAVGLAAFWKKFMEELGTQAGKAVADWIRSVCQRAQMPDRDLMLAARFDLPNGLVVWGYIPIAVGSESTIEVGLSAWADLAWFVEQALIGEDGDAQQMTFIYDGGQWHLAWCVTTGEAVYVTKWGRDHAPDPNRFLP